MSYFFNPLFIPNKYIFMLTQNSTQVFYQVIYVCMYVYIYIYIYIYTYQAWGQIHEYLYLAVFKYFLEYLYLYLYFEFLKQEVFVFVSQILHEIFKYSFLNCLFLLQDYV